MFSGHKYLISISGIFHWWHRLRWSKCVKAYCKAELLSCDNLYKRIRLSRQKCRVGNADERSMREEYLFVNHMRLSIIYMVSTWTFLGTIISKVTFISSDIVECVVVFHNKKSWLGRSSSICLAMFTTYEVCIHGSIREPVPIRSPRGSICDRAVRSL